MRLFSLLVIIILSALPGVGSAAIPAGTDLVFLIDQSGSMMGEGATTTANDPYGKRIEAIKQLDAHLLQSAIAGFVNRFSVIEFGGRNADNDDHKVQTTLSRKEIPAVPPGQSQSATAALIRATLSHLGPHFRGDTDIARAMALAQDELDFYQRNPPTLGPGAKTGDRNRLVVLITDGAPYAKGVNPGKMESEIKAWTAQLGTGASVVKFVVFGFNDADSRYWDNYWGNFWRRVAVRDALSPDGLAFLIDKNEDAAKKIGEVLSDLILPGATTAGGSDTYTAPAYLKGLHFTIDYSKPHLPPGEIVVTDPLGNRLTLDEQYETYGAIRLDYPPPGQYRLRTAKSPYRVQVLPILESAKLKAPIASVKQSSDETIRYRLDGRGPNGAFLPQANLPTVRFETVVETPNGNRQTVAMVFDPATGDVVSQAPQRFDLPGRYKLTFAGQTKAQDGTESTVYKSEDFVQVDSATPFLAHFAAPAQGAELVLHGGYVEVPVELRFRHGHSGADLPVAQVLAAAGELRVGYLGDETSGLKPPPASEPVVLKANGAGLIASLPVNFGHTRWDLLTRSAVIRLRLVIPSPEPWLSGMRYAGIAGTNDQLVGPEIRVRESPLALWAAAAVLLALLAAAILFWRLFIIRWLIERSDRKYKRHPKLVYTAQRDPERCAKEWPLRGVRALAEPRVVELADGTPWSIEKFQIKRLPRPGPRVAVQVSYRPLGAKKGKLKTVLESTSDSISPRSRHSIVSLPDNESADFVLFMGKSAK